MSIQAGQVIEKPWGSETIIEINEHYMVKRLFMKELNQCSLQRHRFKHETFTVVSGTMGFICEDENGDLQKHTLGPGDSRAIPPGTVHRMIALSDIVYIECSTPHPDDVIRLEDSYGR